MNAIEGVKRLKELRSEINELLSGAKHSSWSTAEGRRECVAALEGSLACFKEHDALLARLEATDVRWEGIR